MSLTKEQIEDIRNNGCCAVNSDWQALCDMALRAAVRERDEEKNLRVNEVLQARAEGQIAIRERDEARAEVERLRSIPSVDGVMVPREPTPAMCAAGFAVDEAEHDPAGVYRAMIDAAPKGEA